MPHVALILTGAVIASVAAYTVYTEIIQPAREQRRREEEEEWNAQEMERAIQLSLLEHQHEEQRRADLQRWEQTHSMHSHSTSSNARYDGNDTALLRRRRHADPFSDEHEMQEVLSASRSERGILSDAGPSSRLDTIIYDDTPSNSRRSSSVQPYVDAEDAELLETARSLSLTVEDNVYAQSEHEDLLNSPRSLDGSTLDAYSVIEPTSRSGSPLASRSQSPLIVDAPFSSISGFKTPSTHSQQDLTAAYLRQFEEREVSHQKTRAASPTPTIRSLTAKTLDNPSSHGSPSYVPSISQAHSQPSSSRPISPFSEIGFISAHSSDSENEVQRTESASDRESQWSDLGEDSSDGE